MAPKSPFSGDQLTWIIYKYGELKSLSLVMRAFRLEFLPSYPLAMPNRRSFVRVIQRFESTGGNAKQKATRLGTFRV